MCAFSYLSPFNIDILFTFEAMNKAFYLFLLPLLFIGACKDDEQETIAPTQEYVEIPAFYTGANREIPNFIKIAGSADRVESPQDLDFHPTRENELWVVLKGTNNSGGSTLTISNAGKAEQSTEWRRDGNAWHFMALVSAISFSKTNENFGTTANIQDANRQGGTFSGPSLWSSDMNVYAKDPGTDANGDRLNGSHLDMLHGSPYSLGIESDEDNAFWVYDAYNGHIAWYDFVEDHGPGYHDHSDGIIHRYDEIDLGRDASGIPSHIVEDDASGILYICDPANKRILWMNTLSGSIRESAPLINELLASHQLMKNVEWGVFAAENIQKPCGIEVHGNILYVSDNATGELIAFHKETKEELARINTGAESIMGIKTDKNGFLWYVDADANTVMRVDPK